MRFRILVGHTHLTSKLGSDKFLCASWALIDCASIIFDLNCKNKHNFPSIYESSTASLMSIFFLILKETLPESWLDYFQIQSIVHVYFQVFNVLEEEG